MLKATKKELTRRGMFQVPCHLLNQSNDSTIYYLAFKEIVASIEDGARDHFTQ